MSNLVLSTDSYKLTHWNQYPAGTEHVYSYFESREGAQYEQTVLFGLQHLLMTKLVGKVVTAEDVHEAARLAKSHFGGDLFNYEGWLRLVDKYDGRLPLRIKAVPEGTVVPVGNVMMTVENTDPEFFWLTNYMESLLTHVWYPSTVATLSRSVKKILSRYLNRTSDNTEAIDFMLHDFGYRGASSDESAAIGGAGHLVNFMGTDTLQAMELLAGSYHADYETLAFSVPATEHSVMTARGREGEFDVLNQVIDSYPEGIVSVVGDSYDIYAFAREVVRNKDRILARNGRFVLRPDSVTHRHKTPEDLSLFLVTALWDGFGGETNSKGYRVLNDQVRVLWGDGIDPSGIYKILNSLANNGFSAENMVFGMGGGLLQKVNRDTQRFAFKSSAQYRDGVWHDVQKSPLDESKRSKGGRLKLVDTPDGLATVREEADGVDLLRVVFENGRIENEDVFATIRERAKV